MFQRQIIAASVLLGACAVEVEPEPAPAALACTPDPTAYTPYGSGLHHPSGAAEDAPWLESFEAYAPPTTVECASDKGRRAHLDVTAGCLGAAATGGGAYTRGVVRATDDGAFRAIALGRDRGLAPPIKWTDQSVEYRFHFRAATGTANNPGAKVFARYRTEDDLYVASWRLDGVVQIQEKRCGRYTSLAMTRAIAAPTPDTWHWIRFDAIGDELELYLDDVLALSATRATFSWGTAGVRIDGLDGAYVDDWSVD